MDEPVGLTSVFGHWGLRFRGWHPAWLLDVVMGRGEASKGDHDVLDLAGWAASHWGQLPCGTKNFTGGDKRQILSGHACALALSLSSVTQCCLLLLWDSSAGYQGASKCSSQGSRVREWEQGPCSCVKVGLGPTGHG